MPNTIKLRAGDTEPISGQATMISSVSVASGDISSSVLYAREREASTNHVDGASITVDSVSSTQRSDGDYDVTIDWTFDPASNGPGGANAFDTGDEGVYYCYTKFTYTDSDETRHPASDDGGDRLQIEVVANYE